MVAVLADTLLVWWAKKESHPTYAIVLGMVLMNISGFIWAYTMRKGIESAMAITFYALFTVAACSFVGFVVFHEPLSTVNVAGIFLALISLVLIGI